MANQMDLFIHFIPENIIKMIPPLVLIAIGWIVERHFVGRISTFANTIALNLYFYDLNIPSTLQPWLPLYLNLGLILGVIAFASRLFKIPPGRWFYGISWLYCSLIAGAIILVYPSFVSVL